jgi:hypothetical protein
MFCCNHGNGTFICFAVTMVTEPVYTRLLCDVFSLVFVLRYGHVVVQLVEALDYKPEGRGFESR